MKTLRFDFFEIDGVEIKDIGHEMFKTQNQLTYNVSPSRQVDQSMKNINSYNSAVLPKAEFGFKFIPAEEYLKLRTIVLSKRTFSIKYYDKDFNKYVTHEMYVEPDNLVAFYSLGNTDIEGVRTFTIQFIATLNEDDLYFANFVGAKELSTKWGRPVLAPVPYESYGDNIIDFNAISSNGLNVTKQNGIKGVSAEIVSNGGNFGYACNIKIGHKYKIKYKYKNNNVNSFTVSLTRVLEDGKYEGTYLYDAKDGDCFIANTTKLIFSFYLYGEANNSIDFYGIEIIDGGGAYWQDKEHQNAKYFPNDQMNLFSNSNLHWETTYGENIFSVIYYISQTPDTKVSNINKNSIKIQYTGTSSQSGNKVSSLYTIKTTKGKKYKFTYKWKDATNPENKLVDVYKGFNLMNPYLPNTNGGEFIADFDNYSIAFFISNCKPNDTITYYDIELIDLGYVETAIPQLELI